MAKWQAASWAANNSPACIQEIRASVLPGVTCCEGPNPPPSPATPHNDQALSAPRAFCSPPHLEIAGNLMDKLAPIPPNLSPNP